MVRRWQAEGRTPRSDWAVTQRGTRRRKYAALALFLVATLSSCKRKSEPVGTQWEEPLPGSSASTLAFELKPSPGQFSWLGTYSSGGAVAKFRLKLEPPSCAKPEAEDLELCSGKGEFIAEPGSDSSALLRDLRVVLQAKSLPLHVDRVSSLAFEYVRFGEKMSRNAKGGFTSSPSGDWIATKLFFGEGEDEGEVFLNVNPYLRRGEFSIKDADYGDIVLKELARVL
jgi:hypothetical protein